MFFLHDHTRLDHGQTLPNVTWSTPLEMDTLATAIATAANLPLWVPAGGNAEYVGAKRLAKCQPVGQFDGSSDKRDKKRAKVHTRSTLR